MKLNNPKYIWLPALIFAVAFFVSCDENNIYDQSVKIPPEGWHKDSTAVFSVEVTDTLAPYNFYITLRNNDAYAYRNFYLFLTTRLPNNHLTRDTIELILANLEGEWLGKGFGAIKDNQIPVRRNLKFPLSGTYHFKIEQAMRQEYLKGITDVGIKVEFSE
jgi:gliding motility-associated lipoprotein GldH